MSVSLLRLELPDPLDHAVLTSGGFRSPSLILYPEPAQGSFQVGETGCLPFWPHRFFATTRKPIGASNI